MARRRRKSDLDNENTDRWLLTYADLITLLLAFFVVMYSMSRIDAKKFGKMSERLQGVFRGPDATLVQASDQSDIGSGVLKVGKLKLIAQRIRTISQDLGKKRIVAATGGGWEAFRGDSTSQGGQLAAAPITAEINERGLVIHILESALFESGQATLKPEAMEPLDRIAAEIIKLPNQVRIEGHTDDLPIATARFPSNWELSSARATTIVHYLIDKHQLAPDRLSALGFGEFRPMIPNTSDGNRAKNRRVDIVILTDDLSRYEPNASKVSARPAALRKNLQASLEDSSPR
jgi:chemotaxis protein MotB